MGLFESVQLELFDFLGIPQKKGGCPKKDSKICKNTDSDELCLPSEHWTYEITRKAYKRGLSFRVLNNGLLKISSPKSLSEKEIFSEVLMHKDWVETQMERAKKIRENFPQKKWRSGERLSLLGKELLLNIQLTTTKKPQIKFLEEEIDFFIPYAWQELEHSEQQDKMAQFFRKSYKEKMQLLLSERLNHWAKVMKLNPSKLSLRDTKSQWGSCSSKGVICLNWKIGVFDLEIIDYVIIHELSHLIHQNHSWKFWKLVESYVPERKKIMRRLNQEAYKVDFLSKKSELYQVNPILG